MNQKEFDSKFYKVQEKLNEKYDEKAIQKLKEEFSNTYGEQSESDFYIWFSQRRDGDFLYNLFREFFVE